MKYALPLCAGILIATSTTHTAAIDLESNPVDSDVIGLSVHPEQKHILHQVKRTDPRYPTNLLLIFSTSPSFQTPEALKKLAETIAKRKPYSSSLAYYEKVCKDSVRLLSGEQDLDGLKLLCLCVGKEELHVRYCEPHPKICERWCNHTSKHIMGRLYTFCATAILNPTTLFQRESHTYMSGAPYEYASSWMIAESILSAQTTAEMLQKKDPSEPFNLVINLCS